MTTAIITNPAQAAHDEPRHVERAARMAAIEKALATSGLLPQLVNLTARPATEAEIRAVHTPRLLETLRLSMSQERLWIDGDTYTTGESLAAAQLAAGAAVDAVAHVLRGEVHNAFALIRPPGHHATAARSMGFCLLNNIAIAARQAVSTFGLSRVAIVDYDVHHGNGTQDIFYQEPNVFFCSSHAAPLYPGTGAEHEVGAAAGIGSTLNIPVAYGTGDAAFSRIYAELVIPALRRFKPELILVSAGFDGHWNDPLGPLSLSIDGYANLTRQLVGIADELCSGRIVFCLEGGYNEEALAGSVIAALRVLLDLPDLPDPLGPSGAREADPSSTIERIYGRHPIFR